MKFLFDLQHPAHLHFFRNLAQILESEGHQVKFTGRDKDILRQLAAGYDLDVEIFGAARRGVWNLGRELVMRQWRLFHIIRKFKPDAAMAIAGTYISSLGWLMGVPTYVFYDTEHAKLSNTMAYPFASCIFVPRCYRDTLRWRHRRYNGYHEIAYLHPRYFTVDDSVLAEAGAAPGELFTLVRLVGWGAAHDLGKQGVGEAEKVQFVERLARFGRVFISCEGSMPASLEPYRLNLPVHRIHHLMAHAALIFGESPTMISEGAVLGTPGIYIDSFGMSYTEEQEREYGIVFNFPPQHWQAAIAKAEEILTDYDKRIWTEKAQRMLADKVDVTQMLHQIALERPHARRQ